jgi:hypothetical protein
LTTKKLPRGLLAAFLLALLAGRTPPARAGDPAPTTPPDASTAGPSDAADLNGDGTVTNRERRRYNRRQRRGQGGANGPAAAPDDAQVAAAEASAQTHSAAAGKSAAAAASAMKDALPSADAGAGLKPGGPGGLGDIGKSAAAGGSGAATRPGMFAPGGGAGPKASGNPANPQTPGDFVLAARSGYAPAFTAAGLKLGPDGRSIVRADGSPATAEDYARLRSGILGMPSALSRRPDFFSAVSPAHFDALKHGYRENPELSDSVYKHVGTTDADRDFVHTASCAKMSGDCNKDVDKPSYKKGEFVAPEDLDRMWGSLQKELDDTGKSDDDASAKGGGLSAPKIARAVDAEETSAASPGTASSGGAKTPAGGAAAASTPASAAAQTATRLWRSAAKAMGFGGAAAGGPASRPLGFGALGAAALAALVFALRKRG